MEQAGRPRGTSRGRDWPGALRLASLLGPAWQDDEVQARFVLLAQHWEARRPAAAPAKVPPATSQQPGKWNWAAGAIGNDLLVTVRPLS